MNEGRIIIAGPIGRIALSKEEVIQGIMLADVIAQVSKLPSDTKVLWVDVMGPGGVKQEGDRICAYLESLKSRMDVNTNQIGPIGSVTTKIFLRGVIRVALDDGSKNWFIHNPWNRFEGDAKAHLKNIEGLLESEEELVQEYVEYTKLSAEDLRPLMDSSASFDGLQAVAFGFATESTQALNIAAYIMAQTKTVGERLDELISKLKGDSTDSSKVLALKLQLSDGTYLSVPDATDESQMENQLVYTSDQLGNATAVNPNPGEHTLRDGRKIIVDDKGKITGVKPAVNLENAVYEAKLEEITKLVSDVLAKRPDAIVPAGYVKKEEMEQAILNLKKEIKTGHRPGSSAVQNFTTGANAVTKEDILEWDRSLAAGEHLEMRKNDPEKFTRLYFAKFKALPENV